MKKLRIAAIILVCAFLPGCATLTIATIGGLVAAGVVSGAGQWAGRHIAEGTYRRHVAWRKCHRIRNRALLEQCVRRYAPEYF
jgi:hypothetical protein